MSNCYHKAKLSSKTFSFATNLPFSTLLRYRTSFSDQNDVSRRRREANYDNVYVEQFVYVADGRTSTNVIFAAAEKPSYDLIPASDACKLLKGTEVKCTSDSGNTSTVDGEDSEFPQWIIYIIAGVIVLAFIIMVIVLRRQGARKVCALMPGSHLT